MFGRQDDTDNTASGSSFLNDTPAASWATPPAATATPSAPPVDTSAGPTLLEPNANDGYVASVPATSAPVATSPPPTPAAANVSSDDLLDLKQHALHELSPLVDKLDQSAEEKFRTTMMMIQATDNQALLKDAFQAAQQIGDDKQRAQALLDVINEINYFTQQQTS